MLKRLDELGLITHVPYRGVRLTDDGRRIALEVIRHHRLLESYLADALGMPWDRVHAEAEVLEHVLSEDLEALIAAKLGNPTVDPHGDPIPSADLELDEPRDRPHGEPAAGRRGPVRARLGLRPGDAPLPRRVAASRPGERFAVRDRQPFGGPLFVVFGEREHAIGGALAGAMRVEARARRAALRARARGATGVDERA